MFCSPVVLPYPSWIVWYDANGVPYWLPLMIHADLVTTDDKSDKSKSDKSKSDKSDKEGYRTRIGKWEEVYDVVDGTKTWYNTVTKKTSKKDPFM